MKKLLSQIDLRFSHLSLSIARIAFFLVNLGELGQLYYWRKICFSEKSAATVFELSLSVPDLLLPTALIVQVLLILGLFTRASTILNYLLMMSIFQYTQIRYHYDLAMMNFAFIFLFAPRPQCLSIDSLIRKARGKDTVETLIPKWFAILVFLGVELVYFDSLFFKYTNQTWLKGFSFWLPSSLPHFSTKLMPDFAENKLLMQSLAYLSFFLETFFPLILLRKVRYLFVTIGMGLHLGIVISFPIPFFGLGMVALYFMFIDWNHLLSKFAKLRLPQINSMEFPKNFPEVDILAYAACLIMALSQCGLITGDFLVHANPNYDQVVKKYKAFARTMGLYRHPVYVDMHYKTRTPIFLWKTELGGKIYEAPTYDEKAYPRYPQNTGRFWVFHNWGMRQDRLPMESLNKVWTIYLVGWFKHYNLAISPVKLYYKDMRMDFVWNFEIDNELEKRPWKYGATITITDPESYSSTIEYDPEFLSFMTYERMGRPRPKS